MGTPRSLKSKEQTYNDIKQVILHAFEACESSSPKVVIANLKEIAGTNWLNHDMEQTITLVLDYYKISTEEYFNTVYPRKPIKFIHAKNAMVCLLKHVYKIENKAICVRLGIDPSSISRILKYKRELSPRVPDDIEFAKSYEELENKLQLI